VAPGPGPGPLYLDLYHIPYSIPDHNNANSTRYRCQMLTTELILAQRWFVVYITDLTVNIKETYMEDCDIVELGTASIETRQPFFPPTFFDGVSFQWFRFS